MCRVASTAAKYDGIGDVADHLVVTIAEDDGDHAFVVVVEANDRRDVERPAEEGPHPHLSGDERR